MMKPTLIKFMLKLTAGWMSFLYCVNATAEYGLNLPTPVTPTGWEILSLHNLILMISVVIGIGVFAVMFYSMYVHRKSRGAKAASFYHSTKLEIIWTVIPIIILVAMAVPSTATLIRMEDTTKADMTIKVTGYQWFWRYEYLESGVDYYSKLSTPLAQIDGREDKGENYLLEVDNELIVPVGKKVRLLFTSADVIHAWWVPKLGVKKDAIPGYINQSWMTIETAGTYRGQCAELCGKDHGFMPVVVKALPEYEYNQWLLQNKPDQEEVTLETTNNPESANELEINDVQPN